MRGGLHALDTCSGTCDAPAVEEEPIFLFSRPGEPARRIGAPEIHASMHARMHTYISIHAHLYIHVCAYTYNIAQVSTGPYMSTQTDTYAQTLRIVLMGGTLGRGRFERGRFACQAWAPLGCVLGRGCLVRCWPTASGRSDASRRRTASSGELLPGGGDHGLATTRTRAVRPRRLCPETCFLSRRSCARVLRSQKMRAHTHTP